MLEIWRWCRWHHWWEYSSSP